MRCPGLLDLGLGIVLALLVAGCGVSSQDEPVTVQGGSSPTPPTAAPPDRGYFVTVYFVRHGQLMPVTRPAPDPSTATALALLAAGPDRAEAAMGIGTSIAPQQLTASPAGGDVVTVAVGEEFTNIAGDDQLLATAQLVWTLTGNAPGDRVRVTVDGHPIAVPTDTGLSDRPVRRIDYRSVAPPFPGRATNVIALHSRRGPDPATARACPEPPPPAGCRDPSRPW